MRHFAVSWSKFLLLLLLPGCLATLGHAQNQTQPALATPRINQAIDESLLVTLKGSVHPLATKAADQGMAPDSLELGRTILMLKGSSTQQAALNKLVDDQLNSRSPNYHAWLTPQQFGAQFGAAPQDIQKITQWLTSHGFQVEAPMAGHNLIVFSGTHAQLKAAFHTEIHTYMVNGTSYLANATDPQIPAALASVVSGFSSLNNFPRYAQHSKPQLIRHSKSSWEIAPGTGKTQPQFTGTLQGQTVYALAPYDLATIYNVKPLWNAGIDGTGQTIAIVSDSNINPADDDYFRATFGLPAKKLNVINYGPDPGKNIDEDEASLDVQWAGAVAKNATIDLVVAGNTATSGGIDGAAAYIINNQLATILNVSYGACELRLGTAGNQYYNQIWEQAAAQGITVLAAAGDSGSASCDQNQPYATSGLRVSGIASTPYNVAVGGTDFHSTFVDPAKYWNATNDPVTLASVKSYLPESTWNDSCANPDILTALQNNGSTDATTEALCNDINEQANFLTTAGGSGGVSNCAIAGSDPSVPCASGYPKPSWQSGVAGIPSDGVRDLPDISLMAGNGLWGSLYVYCQSDVDPGGVCDVNNALQGAGGTSFASPVFAGILALVQQKTNAQQGNVNYVLYKLAAAQYASSSAASCASDSAVAGNSCIFYDITDGTIAVPCYNGSPNCTPAVAGDTIGILPGYNTGVGYDVATGLGSVNAYNLVQGWSSATATFLPTTTTIAATNSSTVAYGSNLSVNVSVAPVAPATGSPSGDVGITSNSATPSSISVAEGTLSNGHGTIQAALLPVGTYQLFATYAGDATFAPSHSTGLTVTITKTSISAALTATRKSVLPGQKVTFSVSATGVTNGIVPTGTIIFTNSTTGVTLGSGNLASSIALVTVSASQLQLGANTITASYSGDANYSPSTIPSLTIDLTGSFVTTINPASLTLSPNGTGSAVVTVTPSSTVLAQNSLTFTCPATMPAGIACSFSPAVVGSTGAVTSTLTLQLAAPLSTKPISVAEVRSLHRGWIGAGFTGGMAGLMLLLLPRRRRLPLLSLSMILFSALLITVGCSGGSGAAGSGQKTPPPPALIATTTTLAVTPTTPALGTPAVFTAKVAPGSGSGSPSGTITFSEGSTSLGTATLASGSASFTTSSLPVGSQTITAAYGGDATYSGSSSAASTLDVAFNGTIAVTASDSVGDQSSANLSVTVK
ncbi:Peptidase S53 propeptide [Granulicella mallensis MP5ACTX8]|uniref:Peptidase S53 propeptide n=2 Tax=Granulicella mallensis TaxID=940614 RepID=G8NSD2_GRAMM|nr:Peptidase S53 propeptide [Granulicella mallensis MP5ACTX8]